MIVSKVKRRDSMTTREQQAGELLKRHTIMENVFPSPDEAILRLAGEKPLNIYLGIDPTAPSLHIGNTVPLFFLERIRRLGHHPIIVIGDFTARIGDPTEKESARKALSPQEVAQNMESYIGQIEKILPRGSFDVRYNSEWLAKMTLQDIIALAGRVTVQQMLARDMFQRRMKEEKPIFLHEFLYPLMQGYDSVALKTDGEVGGNDQVFNMLVGRELEKEILGKDKLVLATKLLVDTSSGKKLSKSEGGLVWLSDPPKDMYDNILNTIADEMIKTVFELCSGLEYDQIDDLDKQYRDNPREYKIKLATQIVEIFHGQQEAERVNEAKDFVISSDSLPLDELLVAWKQARSMTEAKALISEKAVRVNGSVVTEWDYQVKGSDTVQVRKKTIRIVRT